MSDEETVGGFKVRTVEVGSVADRFKEASLEGEEEEVRDEEKVDEEKVSEEKVVEEKADEKKVDEEKMHVPQSTTGKQSLTGANIDLGVTRDVGAALKDFAARKLNWIELTVTVKDGIVCLASEDGMDVAAFAERVHPKEPRFYFFAHPSVPDEPFFIMSVPSGAPVKLRMLASGSKARVSEEAVEQGIMGTRNLEIFNASELNEEYFTDIFKTAAPLANKVRASGGGGPSSAGTTPAPRPGVITAAHAQGTSRESRGGRDATGALVQSQLHLKGDGGGRKKGKANVVTEAHPLVGVFGFQSTIGTEGKKARIVIPPPDAYG